MNKNQKIKKKLICTINPSVFRLFRLFTHFYYLSTSLRDFSVFSSMKYLLISVVY